jgi:hypothetical protein
VSAAVVTQLAARSPSASVYVSGSRPEAVLAMPNTFHMLRDVVAGIPWFPPDLGVMCPDVPPAGCRLLTIEVHDGL